MFQWECHKSPQMRAGGRTRQITEAETTQAFPNKYEVKRRQHPISRGGTQAEMRAAIPNLVAELAKLLDLVMRRNSSTSAIKLCARAVQASCSVASNWLSANAGWRAALAI